MNHFIEVVTSVDPRFTIGWAAVWFGVGCMVTAAAWGRSRYREARRIIHVIQTELGHVMRHCDDKKHGGSDVQELVDMLPHLMTRLPPEPDR